MERLNSEHDSLKDHLKTVESSLEQHNGEHNSLKEHSRTVEANLQQITEENNSLKDHIKTVEAASEQLTGEHNSLKENLKTIEAASEQLNGEHDSLKEHLRTVEGTLQEQTEANLRLSRELDDLKRNQAKVDRNEVTDILARVKVAGVGYTLLMCSDLNAVWHQDTQIVKLKE